MTMNWATQQTASSQAACEPCSLSPGCVGVPGRAAAPTLMRPRPTAIGAANDW